MKNLNRFFLRFSLNVPVGFIHYYLNLTYKLEVHDTYWYWLHKFGWGHRDSLWTLRTGKPTFNTDWTNELT